MDDPGWRGPPALKCSECAEPFAGSVPFCPFCGANQRAILAPPEPAVTAAPVNPPPPITPMSFTTAQATTKREPSPITLSSVPAHPPVTSPTGDVTEPTRKKARSFKPLRWLIFLVLILAATKVIGLILRPAPAGTLIISVSPDIAGDILIDGMAGGAPNDTLHPAAGSHRVSFKAQGWYANPLDVNIAPGQARQLVLHLHRIAAAGAIPAIQPRAPSVLLAPPPPSAQEARAQALICGLQVSYDPARVSGQGLAGVWAGGTWSVGACAGLVVETPAIDGTSQVTYVYATRSAPLTPHKLNGVATATDGTALVFRDPDGGRFIFSLDSGILNGRFIDARGRELTTSFQRQ